MSSEFENAAFDAMTADDGPRDGAGAQGRVVTGGRADERRRARSANRPVKGAVVAGAVALVALAGGAFGVIASSGSGGPRSQEAAASVAPSADASSPAVAASTTPTAASPSPTASADRSPSRTAPAKRPSATPTRARSTSTSDGGTTDGAGVHPARPADGPPANAPTVTGSWPASQSVADAEEISLQLINKERALAGVPALKPQADLAAYAREWARHMRETGFAHSANASGAGPMLTGNRVLTGECIVMWSDASMTAEQAAVQFQSMWRNHPPHYKAQINRQYTEIGVGMYHDSSGWWGVHEFAG